MAGALRFGVPADESQQPDERTRDIRRAFYLASAVYLMIDELRAVLGELTAEQEKELVAKVVRHLELAWNDGALREADLRTALATETTHRKRIQSQLHDALRRISDLR